MHNTIQQSQTGKRTHRVFGLRLLVGFLIYLIGGFPTLVFALPQGQEVVDGAATFTTSGNEMVINQTTDQLITNWQSFNIGGGELVEFKQPSASSVALNNVLGLSPSLILGSLKSNGQVFISNGSGIIFGQTATVNVGGLLATTLSIKNEDFMAGNYSFTQDPSRPLSSVINRGLIEASYVGLLAPVVENISVPGVENSGKIIANLGSVAMASGKAATLDFIGDGLINFAITEAVDGDVLDGDGNVIGHRVKNAGHIKADGGRVVLSARDAGNVIQNVVNNEGVIEAHSAVERNGEIFLMGGDSGVVANSGTLDASGDDAGETGGTVHMVGEKVGLFGDAVVDVSGNAGGGTALIGGDVQGGGDVQTATNTYVSEDATITADAIENGDGGKVVVWADDTTRVYGSVSATGGALSGDGGFVETSGKNFLEVTRVADVTAAFGLGGEWLIDPRDITIVAGSGNTGINSSNPFVSTADSSILGVDLIIAALTGGANVTITTGSDGVQAGDITLDTTLDYNGTGTNTLSLIAHNDIILNAGSSILDSSVGGDTLNLVLTADSDLSGSGDLVVQAGASVDTQGGSMQITAHDVDIQGTLNAGAGDVTIAIAQTGSDQIQIGDAAFCPTCAMVITGQELQNITAANLTVENSTDDIYVDSITAANSNNIGTVILDAGGNVEMGRDSDEQVAPINSSVFNALTVEADGEVFIRENLETDTGDLTITADADSSGGVDDWITFRSSPNIVSAGDITLNGSSSSSVGIRTVSFGALSMTSGGTVTFNDDFSGTSFTNISADNGIIINADFITNAMDLNGDANGSADGIDQIVFADGITVQSFGNSSKVILRKAEALGSVNILAGSGIDFLGDFTANGAVSIDADTATNVALGTFTVASGTTFTTNNNTLTINASDVDFQGLVDAGTAGISITMALASGQISLGDSTLCPTCDMKLSGSELQNVTASTLTIGTVDERILVDNVAAADLVNIGSVTLNSGKHIVFQGNASTFTALTAVAKDDLDIRVDVTTTTGDLILTGDSDLSGGNRFKIFGGSVLTSAGDMTLGHSGAVGIIDITDSATMTAGGSITLNSVLDAGFHATLTANDGITVNADFTAWGYIDLDGDANGIGGDSVTFADGTTLESTNRGITLNRFDTLGGITILAANGIDLNDAFTSSGVTTFNADSDGNNTGAFTVDAAGSVNTNGNSLNVHAGDLDLQGTIDVGALGGMVLGVSGVGKVQLGDSTLCPTCTMQISGSELQNITAGTLTIDSSGDAIFVDNVTAANSNNVGTVILNSGKHTVFQGNASTFNALTVNAGTDLDIRVDVTTDTGDMILAGDSDVTGGPDRFKIFTSSVLTSAGDLVLTHSGGAGTIDVTESALLSAGGLIDINGGMDVGTLAVFTAGSSIDVSGALDVFGSMTITSAGTITLDDVFTSGATAIFNADNGINVNGDFTATGNIVLDGDANSSVDGNDTITLADGITVESTTGSVTFDSAVSAQTIVVYGADGINVNDSFTTGMATFDSDRDGNGVGTFTVSSSGSINTVSNDTISIALADLDLQGTLNAGSGSIFLTRSGTGKLQVGDSTLCPACVMQVSGAELENITAGALTISNTGDAIFVDNVSAANSNNIGTVILSSGKHTVFQGNASTFNALTVNAGTDLDVRVDVTTDTGDMILTGDSDLTGGPDRFKLFANATLNSAGDIVMTHSGSAGTIAVTDAATMIAGGSIDINGAFDAGLVATLTAVGSIDVSGVLDVFGSMTMTSGGTITLGDVFTSGATAIFDADNGINVNGNFTATGDVLLDGDANSSADGNDTISLANGIIVTSTTGSVTFKSATTALGAISVLAAKGINVNGTFSSFGLTTLNADSDGNNTGVFTVGAAGSVQTNNNTLSINAFDVDLQGTLNSGPFGSIEISNTSGKVALGDATLCGACVMLISGAELQNITAGTLTINNADDAVFIDNVTAANSDNIDMLVLSSAKHMVFQGNASTFNALTANAGTDMDVRVNVTTDTGDLLMTGDSDQTGGPDRFKVFIGAALSSAGDMNLTHNGGAGTIEVVDNATMNAGGSIDINADLSVGNAATLTAGGLITLDGDFTSVGDASLTGTGGIDVNGFFTSDSSTTLNSDGNINVAGDLTTENNLVIGGAGTVNFIDNAIVTAVFGSMTLNNVSVPGAITLNAANGITINGTFSSSGATVIQADSDANSTGVFTVGAAGSVVTGNNTLTINAIDVDLQGTVDAGAGNIFLSNTSGKVALGDATLCGACVMVINGAELENITAGTLTINNTDDAIFIDNVTSANSNNIGTVVLNSAKHMVFQGNASRFNALTANATTDMDVRVDVRADTGDLVMTADSDQTGGPDRFKVFSGVELRAGASIILSHNGGAGTLDFVDGATLTADIGSIFINANTSVGDLALWTAGNNITLDGTFTAGGSAIMSANNGITVNGDFTAGSISMNGDANSSVDGSDTITLADGITLESTAFASGVNLSDTTALGSIAILSKAGISLTHSFVSNGATVLNSDSDGNGTGDLTVTATGSINTNNNTLSITADDVNLSGTINAGLSDVTIQVSDNGTVGLGNAVGDMTIDGTELQNITAANLILGNNANGDITVNGVTAANSDNIGTVTLNSGGDIDFVTNDSVFNALNLSAYNDINVNTNLETDTGDFVAVADADLNSIGDFNLAGGTTLTSANDINITGENANLNGNLVAGGTITINGVLQTGGSISILAADGIIITDDVFNSGDIIIDADTDRNGVGDFEIIAGKIIKSFNHIISITANDFIISGLIDAGTSSVHLFSSVAGTTIGIGNGAGDIQISGAELQNITAESLHIGGLLTTSGVTVDGVTLGDLANINILELNSAGNVSFSGSDSTFDSLFITSFGSVDTIGTTLTADSLSIYSNTGIDVTTQVNSMFFNNSVSGDVAINNTGAIFLGGFNTGGNLSVTTTGSLTTTGWGFTVSGSSDFTAVGFDIDLSDFDNNFSGTVSVSGANVTLRDSNGLDLGASTITGNLDVTAGGAVTQSGVLTVGGTYNISAVGFDVTLDNAANDFVDTVTISGANVSLTDVNEIILGASTITGALTLSAVSGVKIDGAVTTSGTTSINADTDGNGNGVLEVIGSLLTNNNALFIAAGDLDIQGTIDAGSGDISLDKTGLGRIQLGDATLCPTCPMQISGTELENITAGSLTINNTDDAIFVDNITAANSDNIGLVTLNSAKHIVFQGNESTFNALTANATTDLDVKVGLHTDTGDMLLIADSDLSGGPDRLKVFGNQLRSSAGDMTLTLGDGTRTIEFTGTAALTSGGTITLNGDLTSGFHVDLQADDGINVNGDITAWGYIYLNGDANASLDFNDTVTLADGVTLESLNRGIEFNSQTVALGSIDVLAALDIDVNDTFFSSGVTTFNADSDANGTGDVIVGPTGLINTGNNNLFIIADDFDLRGTINVGSADVDIQVSDNGTIAIGNANADMTIDGSEVQKITAANLTIGSSSNGNVTVDGVTAFNTQNVGTVHLASGGDIEFSGADSTFNALTAEADGSINVLVSNLVTDTGDMSLMADVDSSGGADRIYTGPGSASLSSAGSVTLSSGAAGIVSDGDLALFANGGSVTINDDVSVANNFSAQAQDSVTTNGDVDALGSVVLSSDNGINVNGNVTAGQSISIRADSGQFGPADGIGTITFADGVTIDSGNMLFLEQSADAVALGSLTLRAADMIQIDTDLTTSGTTTIEADSDANGAGDFVVTAAGSVNTNSNNLFITADDIDLQGTINTGSADVDIQVSDGGTIGLGNVVGDLLITGAELQNITAANLTLGDATAGNMTFGGISAANSDNIGRVTLNSGGIVQVIGGTATFNSLTVGQSSGIFVDSALITDTGSLDLNTSGHLLSHDIITSATTASITAGGNISTDSVITATSLTTSSVSGTAIITNTANVSFTNTGSGYVSIDNLFGGLSIEGSNTGGSLVVWTAGNLTQSGVVTVAGTTDFNAFGNDITLTNGGNDFGGTVTVAGANVTLVDTNAIDLGASTVTGDLNVTAGADVTDSGALNIAGTTTITANSVGSAVILDEALNDFGGAVNVAILSVGGVTLVDQNDIDLGTITGLSYNLNVSAGGNVTNSGALTGTIFTTINATGDVTLDNAANNFGTISVTGANVTLVDTNAIDLGASTISGALTVIAGGAVTDSGALSVTGTTTVAAAGQNVTLDDAANDFGGAVSVTGANVTLVDTNAIDLGASTITGNLTVTAGATAASHITAISQSGALSVAGTTTLAVEAAQLIFLDNSANDFSTVNASGRTISLADVNAIDLGDISITHGSGGLNVIAGGDVTDSGTLDVSGTATITAAGHDVILDSATNDFSKVRVTGKNVTLVDSSSIIFRDSTITGDLNVTAGALGFISDDGIITVQGSTTLQGYIIALDNHSHDFAGPVNATGLNVRLDDVNGIDLGNITTSFLRVTSGGTVTNSGSIVVSSETSVDAAGFDVILDNAGNDFSKVDVTAANVTLVDINDLRLGTSVITGNLNATANGSIQNANTSQPVIVAGTTTLTAGTFVSMGSADHDFGGQVNVNAGGHVSLNDINGIDLGDITTTQLSVTAGGAVTDSGTLTVSGTTTVSAAGFDVTLDNALNDFGGAVGVTGANAIIVDVNNINLGAITLTGSLEVSTALGIAINDHITTSGTTIFDADNDSNGSGVIGIGVLGSITTNNNSLLINANDFDLYGTINTGTSDVTILISDGGTIGLGNGAGDMTITGAELQNITANTLNIGNMANGKVTVDQVTATNSQNIGTVVLNSGGTVQFSGENSRFNALTVNTNADIKVFETLITEVGDLILNADMDGTGGSDTITTGSFMSISSAKDLILNSGPAGIFALSHLSLHALDQLIVNGDVVTTGGFSAQTAGTITLNGDVTTLGGLSSTLILNADDGVNVNGNLSSQVGIYIRADQGIFAPSDGVGSITFADGVTLSSAGRIRLENSADAVALGDVTFNADDIIQIHTDFSSFGTTVFNADADNNGTGYFELLNNLTTNNNELFITAADIDLQGTVNAGTSDITVLATNGRTIGVGNAVGDMTIDSTELQNMTAANLIIGDGSNGTVTVDGVTAADTANVDMLTFNSGGSVDFTGAASTFDVISLKIDQSSAVNIDSALTSTGQVDFTSSGNINVNADVTAGTTVGLDAGASITRTTSLVTATGVTTSSGTGTDIFTQTANLSFSNSGSGDVTIRNFGALSLIGSNNVGNLTVINNGSITQSGSITVSGTTFLDAVGNNITLNNAGNDFGGAVSVSGIHVSLVDTNAIDLGAATVVGDLNVTAGGAVTDSGALNVIGSTTVTATGFDVILDNASNDFGGAVSVTGANGTLVDTNAIDLGASTITGALTVVAGGAVTDSGALNVVGTTTVAAAGQNVTLDNAANDFGGSLSVTGANVTLVDVNSIDLGASTITGSLNVTASGDITDSGVLNVTGSSTFTAANGQNIILDSANTFDGSVTFASGGTLNNVTINDSNAFDLQALTLTGNLSVTAGGEVSQSGNLVIAGTTDVNAAGFNVWLNQSGNDFTGAVSVNADFVALFDVNDLELGASTYTNGASIIAGGNLTQSGALNTSGDFSLAIQAQDVTLDNAGNDFQSGVWVTGNNVSLTDINSLELGNSTINGNLMITAGGAVTQYTEPYTGGGSLDGTNGVGPGKGGLTIAQPGFGTPPPFPVIPVGGSGPTEGTTLTVTGTTMVNAVGHDVTLFNDTNDFGGEVGVNAANVKLFDINSITLKDSTLSGELRIVATDDVTINGTVSTGPPASLFGTGASISAGGNFSVTAAGSLSTNDNSLFVFADDIDLAGTLNAGTSNITIVVSGNGTIGLGNTAGDMTIDGSELQNITAAGLTLTGTSTGLFFPAPPINGDITVDGITAANSQNIGTVSLNTGADINFINGDSVFNALDAKAVNDINVNVNVETDSGEFKATADSDASGAGTFAVAATGSVTTNDNQLTVIADDIDLQGTLNAGTSDVRIWVSDSGTIGLGNTAGGMTISGAELQNITAANLQLGSTSTALITDPFILVGPGFPEGFATGDITVDGITAANSQNIGTVTLASGSNVHFDNNDSVFNALNVHAITDINVNTNLKTDTGSFVAIADYELNNVGDFNLASGTTLMSALDIDITAENVNLNGNLNAGGTITINGEIFADEEIFINAVDGVIITEDINNNEAITIDADTNRDGIGDFELVGGVLIKSNGYDISITANDFIIDGFIDAGAGNVNLVSSVGGSIGIGEAWGDIRIDNSELQNITAGNLNIGDELNDHIRVKNVQSADVANIAKMTLNATKSGKSVYFYGPASNLNDLTVNAANDIKVYGGLTAGDTTFNAGDDVKLWGGTYNFSSLTAVADDDIVIYGTLNTVNADYTAGDDIWLDGYQTYTGNLNATAGDDITIDWELTAATATLNAGDDVKIYGTTHFGDLTINAGDDIKIKGNHVTTGTATLTAVDDISMKDSLSFNFLNADAGDDIYIDGLVTLIDDTFLNAGDNISLKGNVSAEATIFTAGNDFSLKGIYEIGLFNVHAGDDIRIDGTGKVAAMSLNAGDYVSVKGQLTGQFNAPHPTGVASINAGSNIYLNGTIELSDLQAIAGNNISIYGNINMLGAGLTATAGDVRLDGYQNYGVLSVVAGDDISIGWELSATNAYLTAADDVSIKGTTRFTNLTVNAGDDISIRGDQQTTGTANLIAGDYINLRDNNSFGSLDAQAGNDIKSHGLLNVIGEGNLSAGDDIHLHGDSSFGGDLNAQAVDDIHLHGLLNVTGDGNLDAGDDIHLHGSNTFGGDLNADAGDDIHSHGLLAVGNNGSLVAGDDIHLHGNSSFGGDLFAAAGNDIKIHESLTVGGNSFMSAGDDIYLRGTFNLANLTAIATDDIQLRGDFTLATADLKANDEIRLDRATVNSGNFSAEADFDNNDAGAFKLDRYSSLTSTGDADLAGYGLKLKGTIDVAGTLTLTDKSAGNLVIDNNINAGSFTISSGGNVFIESIGDITINEIIVEGSIEIDSGSNIITPVIDPGIIVLDPGVVVSGSGASLITQWSSFSVTPSSVSFNSGPGISSSFSSGSVALNNVIGTSSSVILGTLSSAPLATLNFSGNSGGIIFNNN